MSEKQPKLKFEEDKERMATRSPPKKSKVEQSSAQKAETESRMQTRQRKRRSTCVLAKPRSPRMKHPA